MKAASALGDIPRTPDPVVFLSPENASAHAELLSICERLARVWGERAQSESELWKNLKLELRGASSLADALQIYSENAAQRLRIALENAQRVFEEHRTMTARFSRR